MLVRRGKTREVLYINEPLDELLVGELVREDVGCNGSKGSNSGSPLLKVLVKELADLNGTIGNSNDLHLGIRIG